MSRRRAVFFDRDGTLIEETHYCADPARVKVFPGVPAALRRLHDAGFLVFVITNQSGIGQGLMTEAQYRAVEAEVLRQAGEGLIDGV
ncbi:MAG: HAD-IIIA family hydrolase, partial [Acidobacteriota bacterium]|nr:HAD-IIIA family hydrolase [Acidobacteriota bacterium]